MAKQSPETVLNTDRYDRRLYGNIKERAEELQKLEAEVGKEIPTAASLLQDVWAGLYKARPRVLEEVPPSLRANQAIMNEVLNLPKFEDLRQGTRLDEWSSALGTMAIGPEVTKFIPEEIKDAARYEQEAQKLLDQAQGLDLAASDLDAAGQNEQAEGLRQQAQQLNQQGQELMAQAETIANNAVNKMKTRQVRLNVGKACQETQENLENARAFSWGTSPGQAQVLKSQDKFTLARRLTQDYRLRAIAKLAGRLSRIALHKRKTRKRQLPLESTGIMLGGDLSRVLPSELSLLSHPVLKKDFLRRYAERKLLQYELRGHENEGKGPVVCCLDSSGSMEGRQEIWSKAVMLALFQIAAREKRAFACIHFGSRDEIKVFEFPEPRKASPVDVAEAAAFFFGGGTDFEMPLKKALEIMKKSTYKKGDIVFITDGECMVSDKFIREFKKVKAEKEFSMYSVVINADPGGVTPFSDGIAMFDGKDDAGVVEVVFGGR
ncbi:VWA domain-containing protein [Moorella naiadis]|uniref:VWA domain-containing protein n=1 Tax=Moorella naiadis (nom. illeg.) TaxID=3093670 RepID=UPI003D9C9E18